MQKGNVSVVAIVTAAIAVLIAAGAAYIAMNIPATQIQSPPAGAVAGPILPGEYSCLNGICTWNKYGTCNSASSTLASVLNPFGASSTATIFMKGTGSATSSVLLAGTTTKATGLASTDVSLTLLNTVISTTSKFFLRSGLSLLDSPNATGSGVGTALMVGVGPTQRIGIFSTSTTAGMGTNYITGPSCTYDIEFRTMSF